MITRISKLILSHLLLLVLFMSCRKYTHQVSIRDTVRVIVPSIHVDTLAPLYSAVRDTLVVNKNNITTKVHIYRDSIYVLSNYKGDTLIKIIEKEVSVTCPDYTAWQAFKRYWPYLLLIIFILLVLFVLYCLLK